MLPAVAALALSCILCVADRPSPAAAASRSGVLVVTSRQQLSDRTGMALSEIDQLIFPVGDVLDVPYGTGSPSVVAKAIRAQDKSHGNGYAVIQIVGGDGVVPLPVAINPVQDQPPAIHYDPVILSDDNYGDLDSDGKMEVPVIRLPDGNSADLVRAQFKRARAKANPSGGGFIYVNNTPNRVTAGNDVRSTVKAKGLITSGPWVSKGAPAGAGKKPIGYPADAAFTFILQHGSYQVRTAWTNDANDEAFTLSDVQRSGVVMSAACWGGWIAEREYRWYSPRDAAEVRNYGDGRYPAQKPTSTDTLVLAFLSKGSAGFFGSTGVSYTPTDGKLAQEFFGRILKGKPAYRAALEAKQKFASEPDVYSKKMSIQYQFYGVVPASDWSGVSIPSTVAAGDSATALVMDVSGSMADFLADGTTKIDQAKEAARSVVEIIGGAGSALGGSPQVSLATFTTDAQSVVEATADYDKVKAAVDQITPSASTNLGAGIQVGLDQLKSAGQTSSSMIVMSDGLTNTGLTADEIMAGPVADAKAAGVKIFTVGFGEPGQLDEDLLRRIATETGGEYRLADGKSIATSLTSVFLRQSVAAQGNVLADFVGRVAQGQTAVAGTFSVPKAGVLQAVLNWPGSTLQLKLKDPNGANVSTATPGVTVTGIRPVQLLVKNAVPGTWTASVYGQDVSQPQEDFYAVIGLRESTAAAGPAGGGGGGSGGDTAGWLVLVAVLGLAGGITWVTVTRSSASKQASSTGAASAGSAPEPSSEWVLIDVTGARFALKPGPNVIGRSPSVDVVLADDASVSRRHALVTVGPSRVSVRDLDSKTGTLLDGRPVREADVSQGARLGIGTHELTFERTDLDGLRQGLPS